MNIYYSDGMTSVLLGDYVEKRIWFKRKVGRIVYVPGISKRHQEMEFNGLSWVGIQIEGGPFVATVVDPYNKRLLKKIKFLRRDERDIREIQPDGCLDED